MCRNECKHRLKRLGMRRWIPDASDFEFGGKFRAEIGNSRIKINYELYSARVCVAARCSQLTRPVRGFTHVVLAPEPEFLQDHVIRLLLKLLRKATALVLRRPSIRFVACRRTGAEVIGREGRQRLLILGHIIDIGGCATALCVFVRLRSRARRVR